MPKKAVLLVNLGSPDSPSVPDVRRYLREFLGDKRVLDLSAPLRWLLLEGIILRTRPKRSAHAYASVWTPDGSPLLVTSRSLREKLAGRLPVPVALAMRYGQPAIATVLGQLTAEGIDDILLFPQYPHYAMSSWETVVARVFAEAKKISPAPRLTVVQPFYADADYVGASQPARNRIWKSPTTMFFSATMASPCVICAKPTPRMRIARWRPIAAKPARPRTPRATARRFSRPRAPSPGAPASIRPAGPFHSSPASPANHGSNPTPTTNSRACPAPAKKISS